MEDPMPDDTPGAAGTDTAAGTATEMRMRLMQAALPHVPFDGWSEATFRAAARDAGIDLVLARAHCPRGAVDLALAYHRAGDEAMVARLRAADIGAMRLRDQVAAAVRFRLEAADREIMRRSATLFALPIHTADGARAVWDTADRIWTELGDASEDLNWYSKRATLAAVYGATLLYWLGDASPGAQASWDFLDRRIAGVMRIETLKARLRENPLTRPAMQAQDWLACRIRRPPRTDHLPGNLGAFGTGRPE
jgi:ubiquinone biosynthesis protein COQ9